MKRWIDNPQSVRYYATMPGLAEEIPNREKIIEEIIAYLNAMSTVKRAPLIYREPVSEYRRPQRHMEPLRHEKLADNVSDRTNRDRDYRP